MEFLRSIKLLNVADVGAKKDLTAGFGNRLVTAAARFAVIHFSNSSGEPRLLSGVPESESGREGHSVPTSNARRAMESTGQWTGVV